jgi:hypothetical protein
VRVSHATMLSRATAEMRSGSGGRSMLAVVVGGREDRRGEQRKRGKERRVVGRRREGGERRAGPTVWAAGRRGLSGVGAGNQAGRAAWAGRDRAILLDTTAVQWWRGSPRTTRARERGEEAKRASGRRRHQRGAAGAAASNNGGSKQRRVGSCGCGPGPRWHARAGKVRPATATGERARRMGWTGLLCAVLRCAWTGLGRCGREGRGEWLVGIGCWKVPRRRRPA